MHIANSMYGGVINQNEEHITKTITFYHVLVKLLQKSNVLSSTSLVRESLIGVYSFPTGTFQSLHKKLAETFWYLFTARKLTRFVDNKLSLFIIQLSLYFILNTI